MCVEKKQSVIPVSATGTNVAQPLRIEGYSITVSWILEIIFYLDLIWDFIFCFSGIYQERCTTCSRSTDFIVRGDENRGKTFILFRQGIHSKVEYFLQLSGCEPTPVKDLNLPPAAAGYHFVCRQPSSNTGEYKFSCVPSGNYILVRNFRLFFVLKISFLCFRSRIIKATAYRSIWHRKLLRLQSVMELWKWR